MVLILLAGVILAVAIAESTPGLIAFAIFALIVTIVAAFRT